jgi:hypothetical protein
MTSNIAGPKKSLLSCNENELYVFVKSDNRTKLHNNTAAQITPLNANHLHPQSRILPQKHLVAHQWSMARIYIRVECLYYEMAPH